MCFLVVYGVVPEEPSTILKIAQDSTTVDVIEQALTKANKPQEVASNYVLIEEVRSGWEKKFSDLKATAQRILGNDDGLRAALCHIFQH